MNLSLSEHLRNTKRDRERRRELKRTRRHRQAEAARDAARSGGYTEAEIREQGDPLGADPEVMGQFAKLDAELAGPDPVDRMRWDGEPSSEFGRDPKTERPRDPVTEFDRDPGIQIADHPRTEGSVESSLFERVTGTTDRRGGINIEDELTDFGTLEDDVLRGL